MPNVGDCVTPIRRLPRASLRAFGFTTAARMVGVPLRIPRELLELTPGSAAMNAWVARIGTMTGLALAVGLVALIAAWGEPGDDVGTAVVRDPVIAGDALPGYAPTAPDSAIGRPHRCAPPWSGVRCGR